MSKDPFHYTKELSAGIDHDLKLADSPGEAFFLGVVTRAALIPPVAFAEAVIFPPQRVLNFLKGKIFGEAP